MHVQGKAAKKKKKLIFAVKEIFQRPSNLFTICYEFKPHVPDLVELRNSKNVHHAFSHQLTQKLQKHNFIN